MLHRILSSLYDVRCLAIVFSSLYALSSTVVERFVRYDVYVVAQDDHSGGGVFAISASSADQLLRAHRRPLGGTRFSVLRRLRGTCSHLPSLRRLPFACAAVTDTLRCVRLACLLYKHSQKLLTQQSAALCSCLSAALRACVRVSVDNIVRSLRVCISSVCCCTFVCLFVGSYVVVIQCLSLFNSLVRLPSALLAIHCQRKRHNSEELYMLYPAAVTNCSLATSALYRL